MWRWAGPCARTVASLEVISARVHAGKSQAHVAPLMGSTQSVIARLESGRRTPSMQTVQRYAGAVGARALLRIELLAAA